MMDRHSFGLMEYMFSQRNSLEQLDHFVSCHNQEDMYIELFPCSCMVGLVDSLIAQLAVVNWDNLALVHKHQKAGGLEIHVGPCKF